MSRIALAAQWGVLALAALAGCRRGGSQPPGAGHADAAAGTVTEDERLAPPASESAIDNPAEVRLVDRALCRHARCCVLSLQDAGTDRKGRRLVVAETALDGTGCLLPRSRVPQPFGAGKLDLAPSPLKKLPRPDPEPAAGDEQPEATDQPSEEVAASTESDDDEHCRIIEHDLVIFDKKKVRRSYTLSSECEHGGPINYHRMEDEIEVDSKAHTFTHFHSNMKGRDNWGSGVTIGLDPVRLIDWDQSGDTSFSVNWDLLRRRDSWTVPDEEAIAQLQATPRPDGGADEGAPEEGDEDGEPTREMSAISVPKLALPPRFTAGGWKTTGLGSCGVLIDGKDSGYTLHGEANAGDATLRVVASMDGVMFVEVTDDRWTGPSRSWVKDDHLELWLARDPPPPEAGAAQGADAGGAHDTAVQWGIRIADGATFSAFGAPEPLKGVEVVRRGSVARVKIPFAPPDAYPRFAVVYSDGDDGKTQERLIATAPLTRGDGGTLGGSWEVDPVDASCTLKGGALTVIRPPPPRDRPVEGDLEEYRK